MTADEMVIETFAAENADSKALAASWAEDLATSREMISILFGHVAWLSEQLARVYARNADAADRRASCSCMDTLGLPDGKYYVCRHCRPPEWPFYLAEARKRVTDELSEWIASRQQARERAA